MARNATYGPHRYQYELGKRTYNFSANLESIVAETEKRMTALVRQSVQETVEEMQTPVAKGGRMRVDTGFLRASGQLSLTGMPSGPGIGQKRKKGDETEVLYEYDPAATITVLTQFKLGDTIYFGWVAKYAKYREAYDGFLEAAVQNWPARVARITAQIKARITK